MYDYIINMSDNDKNGVRNYIEAYAIIQEFYDDPTVFIVGSAPFGKVWFDYQRVLKQYDVLTRDWLEEYGDKVTTHSKKPRIISILLSEDDVIFSDNDQQSKPEAAASEPESTLESVENEIISSPDSAPTPAVAQKAPRAKKVATEKKPRAKKVKENTSVSEVAPVVSDSNTTLEQAPPLIKEKKPRAKKSAAAPATGTATP